MAPKPVNTVTDPAVAWAEKLWQRLETGLLDTQNTIIAIIDAHAWEPLGYESFSKAWIDRIMSKITIAAELRPHVVYQMFSEGLTAKQVAAAVKGVSPDTAARLKEQQDRGVPADAAAITVRQHRRKHPGNWRFLHLKVDTGTLAEWHRIARAQHRPTAEIALEAVTAAFEQLR
jgi:hypothetical protein